MINAIHNIRLSLVRKQCGKGRNAFSHIPTMFSKGIFFRSVKKSMCGKDLRACNKNIDLPFSPFSYSMSVPVLSSYFSGT